MSQPNQSVFVIGEWQFRPTPPQLTNADETVELTAQAGIVLLALSEAMGEVVGTDELLQLLGLPPDSGKSTLYQVIGKLRKIFYDSAQQGKYIATVPKRGYRLASDVFLETARAALPQTPQPAGEAVGQFQTSELFSGLSFIDPPAQSENQPSEESALVSGETLSSDSVETGSATADLAVTEHAVTGHAVTGHAVTENTVTGHAAIGHAAIESVAVEVLPSPPVHRAGQPTQPRRATPGGKTRSTWLQGYCVGPILLLCLTLIAVREASLWQPKPHSLPERTFDSVAILPFALSAETDGDAPPPHLATTLEFWLRNRLVHVPGIRVLAPSSTILVSPPPAPIRLAHGAEAESVLKGELLYLAQQWQLQLTLISLDDQRVQWQSRMTLSADQWLDSNDIDNHLRQSFAAELPPLLSSDRCKLHHLFPGKESDPLGEETVTASCLVQHITAIEQLKQQDNPDAVDRLIETLLQAHPDSGAGHSFKAQQHIDNGQWQAAEHHLFQALELSPSQLDNYQLLAQLNYRQHRPRQSLSLINQALRLDPLSVELGYWRARYLVDIGQLVKGGAAFNRLNAQPRPWAMDTDADPVPTPIPASPLDPLRFSPFSEQTLSQWLEQGEQARLAQQEALLPAMARLSLDAYQSVPDLNDGSPHAGRLKAAYWASQGEFAKAEQLLIENSPVQPAELAMLALAQHRTKEALALIREHYPAWLDGERVVITPDNSRYLTSVAHLLLRSDRIVEAKKLLHRLITFVEQGGFGQMSHDILLVEGYALLGMEQQALAELADIIKGGWLPDYRFRWWSLASNPNLALLFNSWQFEVLNQLVINRQQMLRLRYPAVWGDKNRD